MREEDKPEIRKLLLFRDMSTENFDRLMQAAYAQTFPAQLELIRQGEPADFLHIMMEGTVELFSGWRDRETTMAVVRPVSTFILAACIKDAPYLMSARTVEKSRIIMIPAKDLRATFRLDPEFAVSTITELASCYRSVVRHAKSLKLRNSRERVAAYIYRQSSLAGNAASFVLPVEKRLLASLLGMTPENFSRAIKSLQSDGVAMDGMRIIITNMKSLEAVAGPDTLIDGSDPLSGFPAATAPSI
ncbi:MAG: helix-turn-helix domain-containing protein [Hoeflea sp.]|uniref:cyclic nucleotide-binding domain-containing protein n=1 Tax=Hoeflea sp. TaxID=1940281 RepID=UPI001DE79AD9|nr:cyclic nucleotide-binding domain-containing protein [Hoeflea sp.]MBU4530535.1 helix-turn-helix domain-containing protein [Alphaproteobacteria bacterium]MBU4545322.1 helix-turn-helix domain-containing protein [Alphaproteobacteria bacterium]MBU4548971.1 helix-turn-helix domain-containing protein [Alphaproteobacteria bacterium]MBV1722126.1 helix-turn-helix domain-containing protein [Hoeflea sp.]MBV1761476.1 helix-turn-helix domain-containing protein [Hoeflea sp.]